MTTSGERLKKYIENQGISVRKICLQNSISYNSFNQILTNIRPLGLNTLLQILKVYPKLNLNWVILGVGKPERDDESEYFIQENISYVNEKETTNETKAISAYFQKIENRLKELENFNEILRFKFEIDLAIENTELEIIEKNKQKKNLVGKV